LKKIVTILFALVLVLALALVSLGAEGKPPALKLTDAYLSCPAFTKIFGPGKIDSVVDLHKNGIGFALSSLGGAGTGISDDFWGSPSGQLGLDSLSGLARHSLYPTYSDATAFGRLTLKFKNLGTQGVDVNVYMNTGFTHDWGGALSHNTYWQANWTHVLPGKTKKVTLDFSNAQADQIADDPIYKGHADWTWMPIVRLDEVTNIGFQVADFSGGNTSTWLVVKGK